MWLTISVILISWLLNAFMDAIDHGKGEQTLNFRWHVLKWFSYAIPYGYIMWLVRMPLGVVFLIVLYAWGIWEFTYQYLRGANFYRWDK